MMMILLIGYLVIVIYLSLCYGTYLKFKKNNIYLRGKSKITLLFIPLMIYSLHSFFAVKYLFKDPILSFKIMKRVIFYFPEVLGAIIEIMLERMANEFVEQHSSEKLARNKEIRKVTQKENTLVINDLGFAYIKKYFLGVA